MDAKEIFAIFAFYKGQISTLYSQKQSNDGSNDLVDLLISCLNQLIPSLQKIYLKKKAFYNNYDSALVKCHYVVTFVESQIQRL